MGGTGLVAVGSQLLDWLLAARWPLLLGLLVLGMTLSTWVVAGHGLALCRGP
jgi:hypothetical protein